MDCDLKNQLLRYLAEPHEGQTPSQYAFVDLPLGGVRLFPTLDAALDAAMERLIQVGRVRRLPHLPPGHVALDTCIIGPPPLIMERYQDLLRANEYFHILPVYPEDNTNEREETPTSSGTSPLGTDLATTTAEAT